MKLKTLILLCLLFAPALGAAAGNDDAQIREACAGLAGQKVMKQPTKEGKGCQAVPTQSQTNQPNAFGGNHNMDIKIEKIEPGDEGVLEEWMRVTDEQQIRGVVAARLAGRKKLWEVTIGAAEQVRGEPLETKLFTAITKALRAMPGVTKVVHEDREVWLVTGNVTGEQLVRACAEQLDRLADEMKASFAEQ